ncbi:tetratricopeptide repeat protein, partial [Longispora fulva]|uniref:tetratricopeptide repeat protein n=2 Tax=Bacteria TaxID=2 RepID=UPI003633908A
KAVASMKILLGSDQIDEITKYQALNDFLLYVAENSELEDELVELVSVFSEEENNTKVYKQLGTFFLEKGKTGAALDYFLTALENEKGDFGLYKQILLLQEQAGNFSEVEKISSNALEIFPSQPWLYLVNGKALNELSKPKDALEILSAGLDFLIDNTALEKEFYLQMARAHEALNQPQKAAEYQTKAANLKT